MFRQTLTLQIILLVVGLAGSAAFGAATPLPIDVPVRAGRVDLDLRDSRVTILIDPDSEPRLIITDAIAGDETEGFALLEDGDGKLRIGQPFGSSEIAPRLDIQLVLHPSHRLAVQGRSLDVSVEDARVELGQDELLLLQEESGMERAFAARNAGVAKRHQFDLSDSALRFTGLAGGEVKGTQLDVFAESCRGPLLLQLEDGQVRVEGHVGTVFARGTGTRFEVDGAVQTVDYHLDGGSLFLIGGGRAKGVMREAALTADQWNGNLSLEGQYSSFTVTNGGAGSRLHFRGQENEGRIEGWTGAVTVLAESGTVELKNIAGRVELDGKAGASFVGEELGDTVRVRLETGSFADLRGVTKKLTMNLLESDIVARELTAVSGKASQGRVELTGIDSRFELELDAVELDVDSSGSSSNSSLALRGNSRARVALLDPCRVILRAAGDSDDAVSVSGCEVQDQGSRRALRRVVGGGRPTTIVTIEVDAESQAEVWTR